MTTPSGPLSGDFEIGKGYVSVEARVDDKSTKAATDRIEDRLETAGEQGGKAGGKAAGRELEAAARPGIAKTGKVIEVEFPRAAQAGGAKAGKAVAEELGKGGQEGTARIRKALDTLPKASRKTGNQVGNHFARGVGDVLGAGVRGSLMSLGPLGAAAGISVGAGLASGIAGGLTMGLASAAPVALGAYLLRDEPKIKETFTNLTTAIKDDSRAAAKVLTDEFVAAGDSFRASWDRNRDTISGVFRDAQPLVDDYAGSLTDFSDNLIPGFAKSVQRAEPAVAGFRSLVGSLGSGVGGLFEELSYHSEDFQVALELTGDAGETALRGIGSALGDLAGAVSRNEDDIRRWGRVLGDVAGDSVSEMERLIDLFGAIGGDGKNGKGDNLRDAFEKTMMGDDYAPAKPDDMWDMRNWGRSDESTVSKPGGGVFNHAQALVSTREISAAFREREDVLSRMSAAQDKLNYLESIGITQTPEYERTQRQLWAAQHQLAGTGEQLTAVMGNNHLATRDLLTAYIDAAAAGRTIPPVMHEQVRGLDAASLAAIGAAVRFDEYGNAIISVPGRKDTVVTAETLLARADIRAVLDALAALRDKTVTVTTRHTQIWDQSTGAGAPKLGGPSVMSHDGGHITAKGLRAGNLAGAPTRARRAGGPTPMLPTGMENATVVNETGQEIFFPSRDGYMATAQQAMRMEHGLKVGLARAAAAPPGAVQQVHHHYQDTYVIQPPPSMDLEALAHKVARIQARRRKGGN